MTDGLFYLGSEDLVAMKVTAYDAEDVLQELIEKHPDLLAGGQMSPGDPRRWLLIKREQPAPHDVGLPDAGRLRVPGLRRSEVASLAGVRVEYCSKIGRGFAENAAAADVEVSAEDVAALTSASPATEIGGGRVPDFLEAHTNL